MDDRSRGTRSTSSVRDDTPVPMARPDITDRERAAVLEVLSTSVLSIGPQVEQFERLAAEVAAADAGVAVSSGTSGLHLCLIAAGVGPGDPVITSSFSFVASANVILYERGVPVFVDIDEASNNIDPVAAAQAAEDLAAGGAAAERWLPPTIAGDAPGSLRALLPIHAFGQPADMDPLLEIGRRHAIPVIEDACESIGAAYRGRPTGALGDAGVFAFYPNKQVATGEGGMIVTRRPEWAQLFRSLRNQGRDEFGSWLAHDRLGYNYRMDELSAALGVVQVQRLDELLSRRERVVDLYEARLGAIDGLELPRPVATTTRMSWFVYVVRLAEGMDRAEVMEGLAAHGVPSRPYFSPIHLQPLYRERFGYEPGMLPVTERVASRSLALPFFGRMTEAQVDRVGVALEAVLGGSG